MIWLDDFGDDEILITSISTLKGDEKIEKR